MGTLGALFFIAAFIYFLRQKIKQRFIRKPVRNILRLVPKEKPIAHECDVCNGEDVYIGKSKIACPKCKRGAIK